MHVIEGRVLWGEDCIGVAHVEPRALVRIADFALPIPGDDQLIISALSNGRPILLHEDGARAPAGGSVRIVREGVALHLRLVERNAEKLPLSLGDLRVAQGVALGAILHATILLMAFLVRATPTETEAASFTAMKAWSDALETREHPPAEATGSGAVDENAGATLKPSDPGAAGSVASQNRAGLTRKSQGVPQEKYDPRPAAEALAFGMIGIIQASGGPGRAAGNSAFADYEGPSATGNIFGVTIDDAIGAGGATLSGWGSGGGGPGDGIGIGGRGTCGAHCTGAGNTAGRAGGFGIDGLREHITKAPSLRCGSVVLKDGHTDCAVQVNGRLPPETVQRVVRQSFGRLRGCYESGLRRNPSLEGRIAVKFVIDREGAVSMASGAEHDLPDEGVVSCVTRGFQAMSFPPPTGGIVTVVYPVVFSL